MLAEHKIPAVSANLFDRAGRRFFDADRLLEIAGVKLGIFGLIVAAPEEAELWKSWRLEARDPSVAARAEVAALRARGATIVIALVHAAAYDETKKILRAAPGIDWAVLGHTAFNLDTPDEVGGTRLVEAMSMGKDFGRLDLHIVESSTGGGAGAGGFVDRGQRTQLQGILEDHLRQIDDLRARAAEQPPIMQAHFAERVAKLEKAIAHDREQLQAHPAEIRGSWFENRILPLDTATPDHPAVAMLVAAYNRENQRRASAGLPVGVSLRSPLAPRPVAPAKPTAAAGSTAAATAATATSDENVRYAGAVACGGCHAAALAFWQTTAHARALATLKKVKRDRDPTCVGCHVTGFLRPGGSGDIRVATARLRDVGCEACHGPGLDHIAEQTGKGNDNREGEGKKTGTAGAQSGVGIGAKEPTSMQRQVAPSVCLGCHTPDQTGGDFNYPHYLKAILGAGHGGV